VHVTQVHNILGRLLVGCVIGACSACSGAAAPQETLDQLRIAMRNTRILCAVMLDTKVQESLHKPPCALHATSPAAQHGIALAVEMRGA
jgi:hypothetical protein